MKTHQKFLIVYLVILIIILPSCFEIIYETASIQPKISLRQAMDSMKEAIKDTKQNPFADREKVVRDIAVSEDGITLINYDNTKRYYAFNDIIDPTVQEDHFTHLFFIRFKPPPPGDNIFFSNSKSAKMFADALYYLKHVDIKKEREREREDCLRLIRQTPVDLILAGTTSDELSIPCSGMVKEPLEAILNEILIEWKSKGLQERLQKSSSSQLSDLVVKLEKGILKLDLKAGKLKDAADADARQVTPPGGAPAAKKAPEDALATARLLEHRKTILMVILASVKQAAAQRAAGG